MIAKLSGIIDSISDDYLILDVNGVGYKVFASARTLSSIKISDLISMRIETVVREDAFLLYGFLREDELYWFNLLTNVQGVGAKVGLGILSSLSPNELTLAIASGDKTSLNRANGVGPKLASRLITELKDKVNNLSISSVNTTKNQSLTAEKSESTSNQNLMLEECVSALVNLGYVRMLAMEVVAKILVENPEASMETLIKQALKNLAK